MVEVHDDLLARSYFWKKLVLHDLAKLPSSAESRLKGGMDWLFPYHSGRSLLRATSSPRASCERTLSNKIKGIHATNTRERDYSVVWITRVISPPGRAPWLCSPPELRACASSLVVDSRESVGSTGKKNKSSASMSFAREEQGHGR